MAAIYIETNAQQTGTAEKIEELQNRRLLASRNTMTGENARNESRSRSLEHTLTQERLRIVPAWITTNAKCLRLGWLGFICIEEDEVFPIDPDRLRSVMNSGRHARRLNSQGFQQIYDYYD